MGEQPAVGNTEQPRGQPYLSNAKGRDNGALLTLTSHLTPMRETYQLLDQVGLRLGAQLRGLHRRLRRG